MNNKLFAMLPRKQNTKTKNPQNAETGSTKKKGETVV
jgi:hypothetical protein